MGLVAQPPKASSSSYLGVGANCFWLVVVVVVVVWIHYYGNGVSLQIEGQDRTVVVSMILSHLWRDSLSGAIELCIRQILEFGGEWCRGAAGPNHPAVRV